MNRTQEVRGSNPLSSTAPSPTRYGLCPFCLRHDVALTCEHVFARWLVERLRAWRVTRSPHTPTEAAAGLRLAGLVTSVCGDCNAGWMSGLEDSFRRAVFARSRPERLAAPTRQVMSRWFTKTAILVAHASGQELLPRDRWSDLAETMPADVRVGLSRIRHPRQPLDLGLEPVGDDATQLASVAVQVDDLVGVVTRRSSVAAKATTLWPIRTHVLRWTTLPVVNQLSDLTRS